MGGIIALPDSDDGLVKHVHTSANVITIENNRTLSNTELLLLANDI